MNKFLFRAQERLADRYKFVPYPRYRQIPRYQQERHAQSAAPMPPLSGWLLLTIPAILIFIIASGALLVTATVFLWGVLFG